MTTGQTRVAACLLAAMIATPMWGDTLLLRNGKSLSGVLTSADQNTINFRDNSGRNYHYAVNDVDSVRFDNAGTNSGNYPPPPPPQSNDRGFDEARMDKVVLPPGTEIALRTNERIDSRDVVEGQTFSAQIENDVLDQQGFVAIPRGSDAALITRRLEDNGDMTLDVQSITVQGRRYRVSTEDQELENRKDGVGANGRTGKFVGGGAVFGAIIGAIAGGGKGAGIGAIAGGGAGAAAQIVTRGKEVHVPAESVLRFRLDRALRLHLWS